MDRVRRVKTVLWALFGFAFAVSAFRFIFGLGASTDLTDGTPWGLWVGFDLLSGVALAAGGFVIAAIVYVFKKEKYHSVVRPAILTAFLGYLAFIAGLVWDVGLPWAIWHVMIQWNFHSVLFEVAWCVMLYTTVLALEFLPVPLESTSKFAKVRKVLVKLRLPLVILGIMLSTLHQSSLGGLFLIMPHRVYPLWYSPLIPVLFFISAIGLGLMMVTFEGLVTSWLYKRGPEKQIFEGLGRAARWVLMLYLGIRFADLGVRGMLGYAFIADWRTVIFWFEISLVAIPMLLLFSEKVRTSTGWQWAYSFMVVIGIALHRLNVGGFTHIDRGTGFYVPSWSEVSISVGIVSGAILVFLFIVERFNIWEEKPKDPEDEPAAMPSFDPVSKVWLGVSTISGRVRYSLVFVLSVAVGIAILSTEAESVRGAEPIQAVKARGEITQDMFIDGNLDGFGVGFKHKMHEEKNGGKDSCVLCHHMNYPRDKNTGCYQCHSDVYLETDAFKHDWHSSPNGGKLACLECHPGGQDRTGDTAKKCDQCHKDLIPEGAKIEVKEYMASSYVDAFHTQCIDCHKEKGPQIEKPDLHRCTTCHKDNIVYIDDQNLAKKYQSFISNGVVVPKLDNGK